MNEKQLKADLIYHKNEIIICESMNKIYENDFYMRGICDYSIEFHKEQIAFTERILVDIINA